MTSVNTIRRRCPCGKLPATNPSRICEDSKNKTHTASFKWQLGGLKTPADILRQRYENNWNLVLNVQRPISPMIKKEDYVETSRSCEGKMNSQAILLFCRATKLDRSRSKNDSGIGTRGPIHPLLHRHGQGRNLGRPLHSGRSTNEFLFFNFNGVSLTRHGDSLVTDSSVNSAPQFARSQFCCQTRSLIAGGKDTKGRQTAFFTTVGPTSEPRQDEPHSLRKPWQVLCTTRWSAYQTAVNWINLKVCSRQRIDILANTIQCYHS